jgi:hypothetical protein
MRPATRGGSSLQPGVLSPKSSKFTDIRREGFGDLGVRDWALRNPAGLEAAEDAEGGHVALAI